MELRRALRRARARRLADVDYGYLFACKFAQTRLDKRPGSHVLGLLLNPNNLLQVRISLEHLPHVFFWERVEQLYAPHGYTLGFRARITPDELRVELAGAEDQAANRPATLSSLLVVQDRLELALGEVLEARGRQRVPEETLGGHDDEGPLVVPQYRLAPQQVEVLGRRGQVGDPHVLVSRELQKAFEAGARVLGSLALVAVWQEEDELGSLTPFC